MLATVQQCYAGKNLHWLGCYFDTCLLPIHSWRPIMLCTWQQLYPTVAPPIASTPSPARQRWVLESLKEYKKQLEVFTQLPKSYNTKLMSSVKRHQISIENLSKNSEEFQRMFLYSYNAALICFGLKATNFKVLPWSIVVFQTRIWKVWYAFVCSLTEGLFATK